MTSSTNSDLHRDHINWKADDAFWRDEVAVWKSELNQAVASVEDLRKALRDHASKVDVHGGAIGFAEQACDSHEHRLAHAALAATPSKRAPEGEHCVETYDHAQQREMHESLERRHHTLLARLSMLMHSLDSDR